MTTDLLSEHEINVTGTPLIPGLRFRRFRGESDYANILNCILSCRQVDQIEHLDTLEDIRNQYTHLVNCDPYLDMLFAEINGELAGYCRVEWREEEPDHAIMYTLVGRVVPAFRRRGLGHTLLHYSEARCRQIASGHPQNVGRFFSIWATDREIERIALLESEGYRRVRNFYEMERPDLENIPAAPLPPGIEIRPAEPEHYRAVWDQMAEAFLDHWGYSKPTEEDYDGWLKSKEFQPELWQIAWSGDQVVGTVLGFINPEENAARHCQLGWTEEITVRRGFRGRGIAKALIARCLYALKERGMTQAALGVDTENLTGALRLYEGMGYRPVRNSAIYRKSMG
jgi:mycothiol synthase